MAVRHQDGKQVACKIISLRGLRRDEENRLVSLSTDREEPIKGFGSTRLSKTAQNNIKKSVKRQVEDYVTKIAREFEILSIVSHVSALKEI